ncbi:MAG TPA: hypothetical protein PKZ56_01530 [Candidatus Paceibacterota bacterium]|nr:hypothetical protein [Candidatus Paceibacterota bacterium]
MQLFHEKPFSGITNVLMIVVILDLIQDPEFKDNILDSGSKAGMTPQNTKHL